MRVGDTTREVRSEVSVGEEVQERRREERQDTRER
jgi:hypothetical protein